MIADPDFKGYIHDVGGPTADLPPACLRGAAAHAAPARNKHVPVAAAVPASSNADHRGLPADSCANCVTSPGVKKVFVRSGIRFDYVLADRNKGEAFVRELVASIT